MSLAGIIAYYESAFAAINGSAPYTSDVQQINAKPTNPLKGASADFPKLAITWGPGETAKNTRGLDRVTRTIEIEGWITGEPGASHVVALAALFADVRRVVRLDPTCGGNAIDAQLSGDEALFGESEAGFLQKIAVQYAEEKNPT